MAMLAVLLVAAAPVPADHATTLDAAVHDYDAAQVAGDHAALERLLAPDYRLVNSAGAVEDKAQFIADLTDPQYKLQPYVVTDAIERRWPNGAVMGGVALLRGTSDGKPFAQCLRFADVWRHEKARWQVVYTQAARAPAGDCAAPPAS